MKRARSALRQINLAPANRFLKNTRRNPSIALQRNADGVIRSMELATNTLESLFVE
jgi:hypothetical protein